MNKKSENLKIVQDDILRYKNNKLGQWLTYGGLAFACLYVMLLYSFHNSTFYTMLMGGSVLLTLVMLLAAFLCAEGVKVYNKKFCIVLLVLAAIEIGRIFIYPALGWEQQAFYFSSNQVQLDRTYFGASLSQVASRTFLIIYLVISAVFFAAAAVYSYLVSLRHESFNKKIAEGTVSVELALKGLEEEELAQANAVSSAEEVK
ncbi:MAG: hypothetical protein K2L12_05370 [Clostridia bacterium]|nr:hypothetical protein [Clostridia bacterium]